MEFVVALDVARDIRPGSMHRVDGSPKRRHVLRGMPFGCEARDENLQMRSHLHEVQDGLRSEQQPPLDYLRKEVGGRSGHVRAVSLADLQQTEQAERLNRFAHTRSSDAESLGELALGGDLLTRCDLA